jgi:nitrogen-specific signal transduction histidine kinase
MFRQIINWRTGLAFLAILIVSGTIVYSQYLARKIARDERQKVVELVRAGQSVLKSGDNTDISLASLIITENKSIPIIQTNEKDSIIDNINLDSADARNISFVQKKLKQFKSLHKPVSYPDAKDPSKLNLYYYGNSKLFNEVQFYPILQLCIVALFIVITIFSIRSSYRSAQNQVWAGMAKETAHQLGTPVSSLEGWVEMLKEKTGNEKIVHELEKDIDRLRLVSDRFGKIGSTPHLEEIDLVAQINTMIDYMRKRATGKINFTVNTYGQQQVFAKVSAPLFDWVIENLLKNSLDALEGKGSIIVDILEEKKDVHIDITDSGKGISRQNIPMVFKPGFTTKKRGWGLGLSLSRRIIKQYHKGEIFVKNSELGKGTTFRIVLKK